MYASKLDVTIDRLEVRDVGGSLLCFLSVSRTTPRCVLALRGSDGCESQVKLDEKENADVVGRTNGYGMVDVLLSHGRITVLEELEIF